MKPTYDHGAGSSLSSMFQIHTGFRSCIKQYFTCFTMTSLIKRSMDTQVIMKSGDVLFAQPTNSKSKVTITMLLYKRCPIAQWMTGKQENLRFFIKRILGGITINQLISALGILTHLEWSGGLSLRFILVQRKMGSWS